MLYDVPPNDIDDVCRNGQTVFCWIVDNSKPKQSLNDFNCIDVSAKCPQYVCARIDKDKNTDLFRDIKIKNETDICFLLKNKKLLWKRKDPVEEVIEQIMKEALEIDVKESSSVRVKLSPSASVDESFLF